MDLTPGNWISIAQFAWLIALTLGTWLRKPGDDAGRKVATLRDEMQARNESSAREQAELRSRQDLLEERMRHLPTHNDIRSMVDGMADMRGKLAALADGQRVQQSTLQLIQEFLNKQR